MVPMTKAELVRDLNLHEDWVATAGSGGKQFAAEDIDLTGIDLRGRSLVEAFLPAARLEGMDLTGVDLFGANLASALLRNARLAGVNVSKARLDEADLRGARLQNAEATKTNFRKADLRDADLEGAKLDGASFRETDLRGANLARASFGYATFDRTRIGKTKFNHSEGISQALVRSIILDEEGQSRELSGDEAKNWLLAQALSK